MDSQTTLDDLRAMIFDPEGLFKRIKSYYTSFKIPAGFVLAAGIFMGINFFIDSLKLQNTDIALTGIIEAGRFQDVFMAVTSPLWAAALWFGGALILNFTAKWLEGKEHYLLILLASGYIFPALAAFYIISIPIRIVNLAIKNFDFMEIPLGIFLIIFLAHLLIPMTKEILNIPEENRRTAVVASLLFFVVFAFILINSAALMASNIFYLTHR